MASKSGVAESVLSLPKGGGDVKGLGEKFQPNPQTGTGAYSVPLALPTGRSGLTPSLSLNYHTGSGNGPFGLGWSISTQAVLRSTEKAKPLYDDASDIFTVTGWENLVPLGGGEYRPRSDTAFARIRHVQSGADDYWRVTRADGITHTYGKSADARLYDQSTGRPRIAIWYLDEATDTFGNQIRYEYKRDLSVDGPHAINQTYLKSVYYVEYGADPASPGGRKWLYRVVFDYGEAEQPGWELAPNLVNPVHPARFLAIAASAAPSSSIRPDAFSSFDVGFEARTLRRCWRINLQMRADGEAAYRTIRGYYLQYLQAPYSGLSLLHRITCVGFTPDEPDEAPEDLPPIVLDYSAWDPAERRYENFTSPCNYLPDQSLSDPTYEIVDLFGNALPCVLHTGDTGYRYWRNIGRLRFDSPPHTMESAPVGVTLADPGVRLADMEGNGSADLLVTQGATRGYYRNRFDGQWASFQPYEQAPSFDLEDPDVQLIDLNGDHVTDALATLDTALIYIPNHGEDGWGEPVVVPRIHDLDEFPDVRFGAPDGMVRIADMNGDGAQDIVVVCSGRIDYWPNVGHGRFAKRVAMRNAPRFDVGFDPQRLFVTDVDGDGHADLVYVAFDCVRCWINQSGNRWSEEVVICGTPVTQPGSVRTADMKGTGTAGVLWTYTPSIETPSNYKYLDFTGGRKPYLLREIRNGVGGVIAIEYAPSTEDYTRDWEEGHPWRTPLPFPVQVIRSVQQRDDITGAHLTTTFRYHHGYWDGTEREFRGFGRVDQRDAESFSSFAAGVDLDAAVDVTSYSPPTETRTWFHLGAVRDAVLGWRELDFSDEFWVGDAPYIDASPSTAAVIAALPLDRQRDAWRALRGRTVRAELYGLDGGDRESRPYTVTEYRLGLREEAPLAPGAAPRAPIFFPHELAQRITEWDRGDDPLTRFRFTDDYDVHGQPRLRIDVAVPRGRDFRVAAAPGDPYLCTATITAYAVRESAQRYIVNRPASVTTYEIGNDGSLSVMALRNAIVAGTLNRRISEQIITFYDGPAYVGLPFGDAGDYGALVRTESLVFTEELLDNAYRSGPLVLAPSERPHYLATAGTPAWTADYPPEFQAGVPPLGGYSFAAGGGGAPHHRGYFASQERRRYDFQDNASGQGLGLMTGLRDQLGRDSAISYDFYQLRPARVVDAAGLETLATYDYRVLRQREVIAPNGDRTLFGYNSLGLLAKTAVAGPAGALLGDTLADPTIGQEYGFHAYIDAGQPVFRRTLRRVVHVSDTTVSAPLRDQLLESVEYFDGQGRLVQSRARADDVVFGDPTFGDAGLPPQIDVAPAAVSGQTRSASDPPRVVVSGWQIFDNKGRVVRRYEPFYSLDWQYLEPGAAQLGRHLDMFYEPRGRIIRTVNANDSEVRVVLGVPGSIAAPNLSTPDIYEPTPWESYTYDPNDNGGRTHPAATAAYSGHWNTPASIEVDALGRTVRAVERNGPNSATDWYVTRSGYDIRGNLTAVTDPAGRLVFEAVYDFSNRALRVQQIDSGIRRTIADAAGNVLEQRGATGSLILRAFDGLNRPVRLWARDEASRPVTLRERFVYGDSSDSGLTKVQAAAANLLGRLYREYDGAGLRSTSVYDFKGNPLERTRQVIADAPIVGVLSPAPTNWRIQRFSVDWTVPTGVTLATHAATLLDPRVYATSRAYDALSRITSMRIPADVTGGPRKELQPKYNRAGLLQSLAVDGVQYVERIAYNARGQRTLIAYGNGIMTRYAHEPDTFRLARMRSEAFTHPTALTYSGTGTVVQDIGYEHDLQGNTLVIRERTPGSGVPNTPPGNDRLDRHFTYDPLYHLHSCDGRECDAPPPPPPWDDAPRCADQTRTRRYSEEYEYDRLGNLLQFSHQTTAAAFTRIVTLGGGNRVATLQTGATSCAYDYDANGNLVSENSDRHFEWDQSDRLAVYRNQIRAAGSLPADDRWAEPTVFAQYLYDANGERVRKLVRKQGGRVEATVYIDGVFDHDRVVVGGTTEENDTLHVMDHTRRIATVRLGPRIDGDAIMSPVKYYLVDHLANTNVRVDSTGALIDREEYTPYGETSFGSVARKRYRFSGKERDRESGLYYHGARYYAPWLARWISCDPAGSVDGLNLYAYTASNPMTFKDSTGTQLEGPTPEEEAAQMSMPELHPVVQEPTDPDGNIMSRSVGAGGYGLSYGSPPGYTLQVPNTYSADKMQAYQRGVLEGEIGRNAGSGPNSTTVRRNTPAQQTARTQHSTANPRPTTTAPGGQGWAQDHIVELQHDLTGRRGTAPTDYRWQDSLANSTEGGRSWALNRGNQQGVPAGGVCRVGDAGRWYNSEGFRGVGRGAGRVLTVYAVVQSGEHVAGAIEADIEQGTAGAQTARAVATEAGGLAGALALAPEAAAAGVVCGPGAWACVPIFGLIGGGVGYFAGATAVEGIIDFGNWTLE